MICALNVVMMVFLFLSRAFDFIPSVLLQAFILSLQRILFLRAIHSNGAVHIMPHLQIWE